MQLSGLDRNLAENVIFLDDFNNSANPAEDIPNHFGTCFDVLTIFDIEQGDVFVDFMRFFGNPDDCATLNDLIALFGFTFFLDIQTSKFDNPTRPRPVAIVYEFGDGGTILELWYLEGSGVGSVDCHR